MCAAHQLVEVLGYLGLWEVTLRQRQVRGGSAIEVAKLLQFLSRQRLG